MKKWILWLVVAIVAALLFWVWPRYTLVGVLSALAGWVGHFLYMRYLERQ